MSSPSIEDPQQNKMSQDETKTDSEPLVPTIDLKEDQENKKVLLLKAVAELCDESSEFEDIRKVASALKGGAELTAKVLSGGLTNFSYKLSVDGADGVEIALFAKVCFQYALWNPDRSVLYDLKRVENEFESMKKFATEIMSPETAPVATPYHCFDVRDFKVLLCQWAPADEQWANQFIDGSVDTRILPKYADALASINSCPNFDPDFNTQIRPSVSSLLPLIYQLIDQELVADNDEDKCVKYCKGELGGADKVKDLVKASFDAFEKKEVLCHNDTHVFNVLVESKPSVECLEEFGPEGIFAMCDWEMSFVGPVGRDWGIFIPFPVQCAMYHAALGREKEARHVLDCVIEFSKSYAKAMKERGNKSDEDIAEVFRGAMGAMHFYLFSGFYILHLQEEFLPWGDIPEDIGGSATTRASLGYLGTQFGEYAYFQKEPELKSFEQLLARFVEIVEKEIDWLLQKAAENASGKRQRGRRTSMLRASGRRVSDAGSLEASAELVRRASLASPSTDKRKSGHRLSVVLPDVHLASLEE